MAQLSINRNELKAYLRKNKRPDLDVFDAHFAKHWPYKIDHLYALVFLESRFTPTASNGLAKGLFQTVASSFSGTTASANLADHVPVFKQVVAAMRKEIKKDDFVSLYLFHFLPVAFSRYQRDTSLRFIEPVIKTVKKEQVYATAQLQYTSLFSTQGKVIPLIDTYSMLGAITQALKEAGIGCQALAGQKKSAVLANGGHRIIPTDGVIEKALGGLTKQAASYKNAANSGLYWTDADRRKGATTWGPYSTADAFVHLRSLPIAALSQLPEAVTNYDSIGWLDSTQQSAIDTYAGRFADAVEQFIPSVKQEFPLPGSTGRLDGDFYTLRAEQLDLLRISEILRDTIDTAFINMEDSRFLAACAPVSGSVNAFNPQTSEYQTALLLALVRELQAAGMSALDVSSVHSVLLSTPGSLTASVLPSLFPAILLRDISTMPIEIMIRKMIAHGIYHFDQHSDYVQRDYLLGHEGFLFPFSLPIVPVKVEWTLAPPIWYANIVSRMAGHRQIYDQLADLQKFAEKKVLMSVPGQTFGLIYGEQVIARLRAYVNKNGVVAAAGKATADKLLQTLPMSSVLSAIDFIETKYGIISAADPSQSDSSPQPVV